VTIYFCVELEKEKVGLLMYHLEGLSQWFPTGVPRHPRVPFTIPRGAAS